MRGLKPNLLSANERSICSVVTDIPCVVKREGVPRRVTFLPSCVKMTDDVWRPNITGSSDNGGESSIDYSPTGAFYSTIIEASTKLSHETDIGTNLEVPSIDASRSNSLYAGATLQVPASQVLMIIKV